MYEITWMRQRLVNVWNCPNASERLWYEDTWMGRLVNVWNRLDGTEQSVNVCNYLNETIGECMKLPEWNWTISECMKLSEWNWSISQCMKLPEWNDWWMYETVWMEVSGRRIQYETERSWTLDECVKLSERNWAISEGLNLCLGMTERKINVWNCLGRIERLVNVCNCSWVGLNDWWEYVNAWGGLNYWWVYDTVWMEMIDLRMHENCLNGIQWMVNVCQRMRMWLNGTEQ